jgi:hypothetical protein
MANEDRLEDEDMKRIEHKLDIIIDHFGISDLLILKDGKFLAPEIKKEIERKILQFQNRRKKVYNGGHERASSK